MQLATCTLQVWDLETCKCVGTLLRAAKPVARLELAAGRLYAAAGHRVFVWALPCCAPIASVEVSTECGAICSLAVGPRVSRSRSRVRPASSHHRLIAVIFHNCTMLCFGEGSACAS